MNVSDVEAQILETIIPDLEAAGYTVYRRPPRFMLPPFMKDYSPGAIALGSPKNLVIEIIVNDRATKPGKENIAKMIKGSKDWELRLYYAPAAGSADLPKVASPEAIDRSINSVLSLNSGGQHQAALLMAWATFEAMGRALSPDKFTRPQTPGRLIEVLANGGEVTPAEADFLRRLANARNQLIHGNLDVPASAPEIEKFVGILRLLNQEAIER